MQIEYLYENPTINRAQGTGYQTVGEWVLRRLGWVTIFSGIVGSVSWSLYAARRDAKREK
jgi:hypothetical protein